MALYETILLESSPAVLLVVSTVSRCSLCADPNLGADIDSRVTKGYVSVRRACSNSVDNPRIRFTEGMTPAETEIRRVIETSGPITFAEFMALALYAPRVGYYESEHSRIGRRGDFYTSVSASPLLGFLMASWLDRVSSGFDAIEWCESGAHDGQFATDFLDALDRFHPATAKRVTYSILEPSPALRDRQQRRLAHRGTRIRWWKSWDERAGGLDGVIFSNELLDAMPIHRLSWSREKHRWREQGVTVSDGALASCLLEPAKDVVPRHLDPLVEHLPEGFVVEVGMAAIDWWKRASASLSRGWLVAFDYGLDEAGVIRPERLRGTARAYSAHRVSHDLLTNPGEQDLTAHVDFPRLVAAGEDAGLETEDWTTQGRWLMRVAHRVLAEGGPAADWLTARSRALMTLTHPDHLGEVIRVVLQSRTRHPFAA